MNLHRSLLCLSALFATSAPLLAAGNGLKAEYFPNSTLTGLPAATRTDPAIDFEWRGMPALGVPNDYFSVRWSGKVEAPVTGAYQLATYSNEGIKVWLNGSVVIDDWPAHATTTRAASPVMNLMAGQKYDIKVEYHEGSGIATAKLAWTIPGQLEAVIPQANLYTDAPPADTTSNFISEFNPVFAQNGWGEYERDRSNGESRWRDGQVLTIGGIQYGRGLGVHAISDLRYQLMGAYKSFYSDIGIDDEVGNLGSAIFEVWLDGVRKFVSPVMTGAQGPASIALDITGVNELKLVVLDGGDGNSSDHADWAAARVSTVPIGGSPTPNPQPTPQPPGTPTGVSATPGNAQVQLAWNSVTGASSYNVYRGTANGVLAIPFAAGVATNSYKDTAVINGTTYFYRVAAVAGTLTGEPSMMVSAKPEAPAIPPPPVPTGLSATPGNAQVSLTWNASSGATGYHLFRSTISGVPGDQIKTNFTTTSTVDTAVTNGTTYFYSVVSTNGSNTSAPSVQASAKPTAPTTPPPAPTSLTASPGNASVTLNWASAAGAASYKVFRGTTSGGQSSTPIVSGLTSPTFKDTAVTNGTTYFYKVASVNTNGTGSMSNEASAKPAAAAVPPAPTGFTATAGNAQITLVWIASEGATSYNLYRSTTSGGQGDTPVKTGITQLTVTDTGLTNGTTYYYRVAGVNANGVGTKSSQASAKPALPAKPPAPTGLTGTGGVSSATLSWTASTGATSYNVYRATTSGGQGETPLASGITDLTLSDSGLTNGATYYYKVAGVNAGGVGNKSSQVSVTPSPQPTVLTPEQMSAFRFLRQSTWGPTPDLMTQVARSGKATFLDAQFALPATPYSQALEDKPNMELVSEQFFQNALQGPDQLRQRVAWALSQIWVVSAVKVDNTHAMVPYIRMLQENAFGNVRDLLEKVTLMPAMGEFLDMVNNKKASNGAMPNENYARELLQLFTLGLTTLNPDGTPGTTPSYTQNDVLELARVLTGWTYGDTIAGDPTKINKPYYGGPMEPVAIHHDTGAKTVLGANFPANQSARADLGQALDVLFNHPNLGPFLVKQLIQRLVKSNPSPQYVSDIVAVFNNNGRGVRGDLRAVVRALLLHNEAATPGSGKFSEPALFLTTLARGLNSTVTDHPYMADFSQDMGQRIWFAPSVFNYFSPGYRSSAVPGGVLAPELQIWSTATAMTRTNFVASLVSGGFGSKFTIDTTPYLPFVGNPAALVDEANARLMGGTMGPEMRQAIITAAGAATSNTDRIRTVLYLVGSSMQYQVEH